MPQQDKPVESISRALQAIGQFSSEHPSFTITELAARINASRATTRRVLHTLVEDGYAQAQGARFKLTPKIMSLGFSYLSSLSIWEIAQPYVMELSRDVDETCSMSVLDKNEIVYVIRSTMHRGVMSLNVGSRLPAYATSMGKALLAHLDDEALEEFFAQTTLERLTENTISDRVSLLSELDIIRKQGFSTANGEREIGVRSAAAPILTRSGQAVAAINISTNAVKISEEALLNDFVPTLVVTAQKISDDIQYYI